MSQLVYHGRWRSWDAFWVRSWEVRGSLKEHIKVRIMTFITVVKLSSSLNQSLQYRRVYLPVYHLEFDCQNKPMELVSRLELPILAGSFDWVRKKS